MDSFTGRGCHAKGDIRRPEETCHHWQGSRPLSASDTLASEQIIVDGVDIKALPGQARMLQLRHLA